MGEPGRPGVAAVEHDGCRVPPSHWRRRSAGSARRRFPTPTNVFIERRWRSLKYEDIYLKGYADGREAKAGIAQWLAFYNHRRPHKALANRIPMAVWRDRAGGVLGGEAVDMTLRFDNPGGLPTAPATASPCSLTISGDRSGGTSNQQPGTSGPADGSTSLHR